MLNLDIDAVWQQIRFFESRETLRQVATDRFGFEIGSSQTDDILACLQLARDYFNTSKMASITIKPLPLFYGMTNLVKGLIVLCGGKEQNRVERVARGHGLRIVRNSNTLEDIACKSERKGAFCAFLDTFQTDIQFQFPGMVDARLRSAGSSELEGQEFTLRDLFGWFPVLRSLYEQTLGVTQPIVRVVIRRDPMGGPLVLGFPDGMRYVHGDLVKGFPVGTRFKAEQHFVRNADVVREIVASALPANGWLDWVDMSDGGIGWPFGVDVMIERDVAKTRHLAPWMAQYAAMFILSGVVRYHPTLWIGMINRKGSSKMLALVEAFVSFAEVDFPRRALEMLKRVTIVKGCVTSLDELIVGSLG